MTVPWRGSGLGFLSGKCDEFAADEVDQGSNDNADKVCQQIPVALVQPGVSNKEVHDPQAHEQTKAADADKREI